MWLLIPLLLSVFVARAQLPPGTWKTDLSKRSIDLRELRSGGPPKDGIPAIDRPKFVGLSDARQWLQPKEPVLVVDQLGAPRAYPLQILIWHELVNDEIAGTPILVSYCPLCGSALVFDRRAAGRTLDFGVSGLLRESDLVMYDRQTDSLWQQITGEAIVGELTGAKLALLDSKTLSFEEFARQYQTGTVLSRETGFDRAYGRNPYTGYEFGRGPIMPVSRRTTGIRPLERIVTVSFDGGTRAYPFALLRQNGIYGDEVKGQRLVIFFDDQTLTPLDASSIGSSRRVGSVSVFDPQLDGKRLSFRKKDGRITDRQTGSVWNMFGVAVEGPLAGKRLRALPHGVYFAFAWLAFRPDTEVVGQTRDSPP